MKHWKIILGIIGIFLLGMVAGGLLTLRIERRLVARGPDAWAQVVIRRLSWELRLDAHQREQLSTIVHEAQHEMKAVHDQVQPQIRTVLEGARDKARAILRPDQQTKFDKLVADKHQKWTP